MHHTLMVENKPVVSVLNDLMTVCGDGAKLFQKAANGMDTTNSVLGQKLRELSEERQVFGSELRQMISAMNGDVDEQETHSLKGNLHAGWTQLKSVVMDGMDGEEGAILVECERSEEASLRAYRVALETLVHADAVELVRQQHNQIVATLKEIRKLHSQFSHS